jgi:hypothetical protein
VKETELLIARGWSGIRPPIRRITREKKICLAKSNALKFKKEEVGYEQSSF